MSNTSLNLFIVGHLLQQVAHFFTLGPQIEVIVLLRGDFDGYPLGDLQTKAGQAVDLVRVVGEQPQLFHPQVPEDLGSDPVLPQVGGEAQLDVGLHRVISAMVHTRSRASTGPTTTTATKKIL